MPSLVDRDRVPRQWHRSQKRFSFRRSPPMPSRSSSAYSDSTYTGPKSSFFSAFDYTITANPETTLRRRQFAEKLAEETTPRGSKRMPRNYSSETRPSYSSTYSNKLPPLFPPKGSAQKSLTASEPLIASTSRTTLADSLRLDLTSLYTDKIRKYITESDLEGLDDLLPYVTSRSITVAVTPRLPLRALTTERNISYRIKHSDYGKMKRHKRRFNFTDASYGEKSMRSTDARRQSIHVGLGLSPAHQRLQGRNFLAENSYLYTVLPKEICLYIISFVEISINDLAMFKRAAQLSIERQIEDEEHKSQKEDADHTRQDSSSTTAPTAQDSQKAQRMYRLSLSAKSGRLSLVTVMSRFLFGVFRKRDIPANDSSHYDLGMAKSKIELAPCLLEDPSCHRVGGSLYRKQGRSIFAIFSFFSIDTPYSPEDKEVNALLNSAYSVRVTVAMDKDRICRLNKARRLERFECFRMPTVASGDYLGSLTTCKNIKVLKLHRLSERIGFADLHALINYLPLLEDLDLDKSTNVLLDQHSDLKGADFSAFKHSSRIRSIQFENFEFYFIQFLEDVLLRWCPNLNHLALVAANLLPSVTRQISKSKLESLSLAYNDIELESIEDICEMSELRKLGLVEANLHGEHVSMLLDQTGGLPKLDSLKLSFNNLSAKDCFKNIVTHQTLTTLEAAFCSLSMEYIQHLSQNSSLTKLDLRHNDINDELCLMLGKHPNLRYLDLSGNKITGSGCSQLIQATRERLEVLLLADNSIQDEGVAPLSNFVTRQTVTNEGIFLQQMTLRTINLASNMLTDKGAKVLLRENVTLRSVNVERNKLSDKALTFLLKDDGMQYHNELRELRIVEQLGYKLSSGDVIDSIRSLYPSLVIT